MNAATTRSVSITESLLDEDDFLMSALDRMSFDMEHGDGRLYEFFMAAMKEQRDRVLEELDDVYGAGGPSDNATQHDTSSSDLVKILDASQMEVEKEGNGVTCLNRDSSNVVRNVISNVISERLFSVENKNQSIFDCYLILPFFQGNIFRGIL